MQYALLAEPDQSIDAGRLVAKAAVNAAVALGLSQADLAQVIGVSASQVSKLKGGAVPLQGKPCELALCLVRVFRSLDTLSGGDARYNRDWMGAENLPLGGVPANLVKSATGLVDVMNHLDAARAPL